MTAMEQASETLVMETSSCESGNGNDAAITSRVGNRKLSLDRALVHQPQQDTIGPEEFRDDGCGIHVRGRDLDPTVRGRMKPDLTRRCARQQHASGELTSACAARTRTNTVAFGFTSQFVTSATTHEFAPRRSAVG